MFVKDVRFGRFAFDMNSRFELDVAARPVTVPRPRSPEGKTSAAPA
ncbi:hypothetical protein [Streptomyces sp. NPDC055134]